MTGSFDGTCRIWDVESGRGLFTLTGHTAEISNCMYSFAGDQIVTGSMDGTARIWNATTGDCRFELRGHADEVLDAVFNASGSLIATGSADGTARIFNALNGRCMAVCEACDARRRGIDTSEKVLDGHADEVSKVCFNPQGSQIVTASKDCTARVWDVSTGEMLTELAGHTDEIFSCAFNYAGNIIITGQSALGPR